MWIIIPPNYLWAETTANLAISGTYTWPARQVAETNVNSNGTHARGNNFNAHFISDQASATNGARIEGSQDGSTNWRVCGQTTLVASTPAILSVPITFPFYRVILVNSTIATTALSITSSQTL